jgi:hypothetical protein
MGANRFRLERRRLRAFSVVWLTCGQTDLPFTYPSSVAIHSREIGRLCPAAVHFDLERRRHNRAAALLDWLLIRDNGDREAATPRPNRDNIRAFTQITLCR